ncbi:YfiR family protein [Acidobacteria bacterium AB60]|nr:YfiR family protein [Acidobacteria bacterium AB60]
MSRAPQEDRPAIRSRWRAVALWLAVLLPLLPCRLPGQQDERAVRAAFVFNLTKYVSWPGEHRRLVIGVVGDGEMGAVLKQVLDGKLSEGRRIAVVQHAVDAELNECDLLYVNNVSPAQLRSILARAGKRAVLTVGDSDRFVRAGGMVGLIRSGDQIEIEVNLQELRSRQLNMSSRLLNLATVVSPAEGGR